MSAKLPILRLKTSHLDKTTPTDLYDTDYIAFSFLIAFYNLLIVPIIGLLYQLIIFHY